MYLLISSIFISAVLCIGAFAQSVQVFEANLSQRDFLLPEDSTDLKILDFKSARAIRKTIITRSSDCLMTATASPARCQKIEQDSFNIFGIAAATGIHL